MFDAGTPSTTSNKTDTEVIPQHILEAAKAALESLSILSKEANNPLDPFFDLESPLALPEEIIMVDHFRQLLGAAVTDAPQCNYPEITGEITLLRCLRGRVYDIPDCLLTFRAHIAKREELGLNAIRERIVQEMAATNTTTDQEHNYNMDDLVHGTVERVARQCVSSERRAHGPQSVHSRRSVPRVVFVDVSLRDNA